MGFLELGQETVFLVGEVPAGGEDQGRAEAEDEQAEQRGDEGKRGPRRTVPRQAR